LKLLTKPSNYREKKVLGRFLDPDPSDTEVLTSNWLSVILIYEELRDVPEDPYIRSTIYKIPVLRIRDRRSHGKVAPK